MDLVERELQEDVLPRLLKLGEERENLLNQLQASRRSVTSKRIKKSKELSAELNHKVRLNVRGRANASDFQNAIQNIASGSRIYSTDLAVMAQKCHPVPFAKRILENEFEKLAEDSGLDADKFRRLWDTIVERERLVALYELQLTDVEDIIDVQLRVDQNSYRDLERLSHGQKCMVVLMIALAEGDFHSSLTSQKTRSTRRA